MNFEGRLKRTPLVCPNRVWGGAAERTPSECTCILHNYTRMQHTLKMGMQNILANQKICPLKENNTGCPLVVSALDDVDRIQSSERHFSPQISIGPKNGLRWSFSTFTPPFLFSLSFLAMLNSNEQNGEGDVGINFTNLQNTSINNSWWYFLPPT